MNTMKKLLLLLCLILTISVSAQTEPITSVMVGAGSDFTTVPLSPQSSLSHSQTIYYKEQLEFRGFINEISYFTPFSNSTSTNMPVDPANLTIKLAVTDIEEFDEASTFIPDSEFTQMTNILRSTSVYEVRYTFETPFYYDGTQNLVIDVEDLNPAASSSATAGYRGAENFGNPPVRSIISLSAINNDGTISTNVLKQNAFPQTKFYGDLERCALVFVTTHSDVLSTSAVAEFSFNDAVTAVRYNVSEDSEAPKTYQTTTASVLPITGLLPAQRYYTHVKSDCDEISSDYQTYSFKTRPTLLTVPHSIDFEGGFQRDYSPNRELGIEVSPESANNSTNGIRFYGAPFPLSSTWNNFGNPFDQNQEFINQILLDVDLTGAVNPVIQFDIKQPIVESYFRVKVSDFGIDFVTQGFQAGYTYHSNIDDADEFKKVVIDLSDYVGQQITLKLQCASKFSNRETYLDNIELLESNCAFNPTVNFVNSETSVSVDWNSSQPQHDVVIAPYAEYPDQASALTSDLNYDFTNLDVGASYEVFLRSHCATSFSPYAKTHVTTKTTPLEIPYSSSFSTSLTDGEFFAVQYQDGAAITQSNGLVLFQQLTNTEWVGGDATTESQAWNDNTDFVTTVNYRIDGTNAQNLNMLLRFKQFHSFYSNPTHSWFKVLINGVQVGPSYNPLTRNLDPITDLNIDLAPYIGGMIDLELQQVGRYFAFGTGAASGDAVRLVSLAVSGTLSVESSVLNEAIKIYPNPTSDQITISTTVGLERINILDLNGRLLNTINRNGELEPYVLDVNQLSKGVYFLELIAGDLKSTKKFIKN